MRKAYERLLSRQKTPDSISVSEITRQAGVNRSTFYEHYGTISDLKRELEAELISQFKTQVVAKAPMDPGRLIAEGRNIHLLDEEVQLPYLQFVKEHAPLFRELDSGALFNDPEYKHMLVETVFIPTLRHYGIEDPQAVSLYSSFYISGFHALVGQWVKDGCAMDARQVLSIIRLIVGVEPVRRHLHTL